MTIVDNLIDFLYEQKEKREIKRCNNYQTELVCGTIRLWDIPVRFRRGKWCTTFYVLAFRYARDSGAGRPRFQEDYVFLLTELNAAKHPLEQKRLQEAYSLITARGITMKYL